MALCIAPGQYQELSEARDEAKRLGRLEDFQSINTRLGRALGGAYYARSSAEVFGAAKAAASDTGLKLHVVDDVAHTINATTGLGFWTRDCLVNIVVREYNTGSWLEVTSMSAGIEYLDGGRNHRVVAKILERVKSKLT